MQDVIFCADMLVSSEIDSMYSGEGAAAQAVGWRLSLIDYESLQMGNGVRAAKRVAAREVPVSAVYRGWMLKPHQYEAAYDALQARGLQLINTPEAYQHCHYLPESYPVIEAYTPRSVWVPHDDTFTMEKVYDAVKSFGNAPIVVKDYVKSQKHYWHEAFFIPNAADSIEVNRVVGRFLELQGSDLNVGLVFREFVEFVPLTTHSQSGMPLTKEYRVFVLDGRPLFVTRYWTEGDYQDEALPLDDFEPVMRAVNSRFFTMDIAQRTDGSWMIVELGDAQVAGLPEHADLTAFYQRLFDAAL